MKKFLYDHRGNVARVLHTPDKVGMEALIETIEDVEPVIESAKVLREQHRSGGDMKHVARVPVTVVERAMREGWFHDQKAWNRYLNDPDNRGFRVWEGRL